ncbi:MAG: twin-arginine translocase TatA/TatE family subunit, partial [Syntrophotalea acetylenica]|nr:twin-arginine translocase TatA/TatE family subunit [Syntrophotalea acetylenica]
QERDGTMPGFWELTLILIIIVLLFGARTLPEIGASLGKGLTAFQKSLRGTPDDDPDNDHTDNLPPEDRH